MKPFETFRSVVAPLDRANVDTDQIIPKQFLKSIVRTGFGENLFFDWRYLADGKPNPEFILNRVQYRKAEILVTRNNFGCGSSREHAVWAIQQYGFRALIAPHAEREGGRVPAFADIFKNNCAKNSVLTVELSSGEVDEIFAACQTHPQLEATVDLQNQKVTLHLAVGAKEKGYPFEMDPAVKERLLRGLDDIGLTLRYAESIRDFESDHNPQRHFPHD